MHLQHYFEQYRSYIYCGHCKKHVWYIPYSMSWCLSQYVINCVNVLNRFHIMDTEIVIVCLVYMHCLFLQANEGRKDESLTQQQCRIPVLWWNLPINTLCLEGPVINVVASNQVLYAYYFGVCIEMFLNPKYFKCCTCFLFVADHSIFY